MKIERKFSNAFDYKSKPAKIFLLNVAKGKM